MYNKMKEDVLEKVHNDVEQVKLELKLSEEKSKKLKQAIRANNKKLIRSLR